MLDGRVTSMLLCKYISRCIHQTDDSWLLIALQDQSREPTRNTKPHKHIDIVFVDCPFALKNFGSIESVLRVLHD